MKRLFAYLFALLALLPSAGFAQSNINISVTYTSGAAAAATAAGTTVPAKVTNVVNNVINPNYTANGITSQFTAYMDSRGAMGDRAPPDSAAIQNVYVWEKYNIQPWEVRTSFDASISVHVTATPGATSYAGSASAGTGGPNESTIVIPYALLDTQLEIAISKILNSGAGLNGRERSYASDPRGGANYCWHTKESVPSDPSTLVPYPPYWITNAESQTKAQTQNDSCHGWQIKYNAQIPAPTYPAVSFTIQSVDAITAICQLRNPLQPGEIVSNPYMYRYFPSGAEAIAAADCPEQALTTYAAASVTAMNARRATVLAFQGQNATIKTTKKTSLEWLACYLFNPRCD